MPGSQSGPVQECESRMLNMDAGEESDRAIVCAGQRPDQVGWSPTGARVRGAVSKSGGNAALDGGDPVSMTPCQVASVAAGSTTVSVSSGTSISEDPGLGSDAGTNSDSEPSEGGGY